MNEYVSGKYSIKILYEDNHLLVVRKPPNMATQADASGDMDLQSALKQYIKEEYSKPGDVFLALCQRLDRPVGGVMVLCRTSKAAERLTKQFAERDIKKGYLCVVRGVVSETLELEDYLVKGFDGMVRVTDAQTPGAKRASLTATPLSSNGELTLLKVELHTGRAHQIRVQLTQAGYPLWGDNRYGGGVPGQQIALWATYLELEHPIKKERMSFSSLPPEIEPWLKWTIGLDGENLVASLI